MTRRAWWEHPEAMKQPHIKREAVGNSRMDEVQLVMFLLGITVLILTALTLKTGNGKRMQ